MGHTAHGAKAWGTSALTQVEAGSMVSSPDIRHGCHAGADQMPLILARLGIGEAWIKVLRYPSAFPGSHVLVTKNWTKDRWTMVEPRVDY